MTVEEMEKKRREMMSDAEMRDVERRNKVQEYRERESKEKSEAKREKKGSDNFVLPLLANIVDSKSLEDMVKQRTFTSQRGEKSMESHFARK
jgi:hypothetical protein